MSLTGEQVLLRFYLVSADRAPHTPTHELILKEARKRRLAGATLLKAIMGSFGDRVLTRHAMALTENLPVILEMVDTPDRIVEFLDHVTIEDGFATLERARVMMYRQPKQLRLGESIVPLSTLPKIKPRDNMTIQENGVLLRIFIGEADRFEGKPLYEAIVQKARSAGLAGATVLRGVEGFGANSVVHRAGLLEMSTDLPIVIEIVDDEVKVRAMLPELERMVAEGMITMENVMVLMYRHRER